MRMLRILRDLFLVFTSIFTGMIILTVLAGVEHSNQSIVHFLILALVYSIMCLVFFWEGLREKIGYLPIEVGYVICANLAYIIMGKIVGWNFSVRGYIINISFTIISYIVLKIAILSIDKIHAEKINELLAKRKKGGGYN